MEAGYGAGPEIEIPKMFDQYLYKRSEHLNLSLSVPLNPRNYGPGGAMDDQTFHTPSFGDEEFDIPSMHGANQAHNLHNNHIQYTHAPPQMGMMNPAQDGLAPPGGAPSYQQPLYLQDPQTPLSHHIAYTNSASTPSGNFLLQQQPSGGQQLLVMQPAHSVQSRVMGAPPVPATANYNPSPQRSSPPTATTSEDSDDSHHAQLPGDAESLLPIHYCSATARQHNPAHPQIGVGAIKRPSPEPVDSSINRVQTPKKPKVQKKKKKRDPNEPQKPVSAYALFFRDTQAAIKGQNPNASFGEVSKIVASMWDGLDSDHKSVYKQKTEAAKKEYLKALAAYRASLVSKGTEQANQPTYNSPPNPASSSPYRGYYPPNAGYTGGPTPQGYSPQAYPPSGHSPQNYHQSGQSPQRYTTGQNQAFTPNCNMVNNYGPAQSPSGYRGNLSPPHHQQPHLHYLHHSQQQMQQQQQQQLSQQHIRDQQMRDQQQMQQRRDEQQQMNQQQPQMTQQQNSSPQPQPPAQQQQQQQQTTVNQNGVQQRASPDQCSNGSEGSGSAGGQSNSSNGGSGGNNGACIRRGCTNPAVANSEWEDEYCSNECVVSHCRDVFNSWVASNNNQSQNYSNQVK